MQIGAGDGAIGDPIYNLVKKYNWSGLLVEPQPHIFKKLKQNYSWSKKVKFENCAINNKNGIQKMYVVNTIVLNAKQWWWVMSSLNKEKLILDDLNKSKQSGKLELLDDAFDVKKLVFAVPVACQTLGKLLKSHNIKRIGLLQINAEGHDFEIIKQADFNTIKPKVINYEHTWLSKEQKTKCKQLLESNKYVIDTSDVYNTIAF